MTSAPIDHLAWLETEVLATLFSGFKSHRDNLADDTARGFHNDVCKNEDPFMERLDRAILEVIDHPEKIQKTTAIGTLF